jgi:hypothetical protein
MLESLKEIAELMRSDLFQLDNETEEELLKAGIISKYKEDLLDDLEDTISLIDKLKKVDLSFTKRIKKISCDNCSFSSSDERAFNYTANNIICHNCN